MTEIVSDTTSDGNAPDNPALSAFRDYLISAFQLDNLPTKREVKSVEGHVETLCVLANGLVEGWVRPNKNEAVSHGIAIEW